MATKYQEEIDSAYEDLLAAGGLITITRTPKTINLVTGAKTDGTPVSWDMAAAVFPATQNKIKQFDNGATEEFVADKHRYVLGAGKNSEFDPEAGDVMVFENASWFVVGCTPLKPDGVAIIYKIGVRQL